MADDERLALRYAVASDIGQYGSQWDRDAAYAGPHLLSVVAGIEHMSTPVSPGNLAIDMLRELDAPIEITNLAATLERSIAHLRETFGNHLESDPGWEGTAAHLTVILWQDHHMAVAHAGGTGAYLIRDGELTRLTKDHTVGRLRIDAGEITPDEMGRDPRDHLVYRYLEGTNEEFPDIYLHEVTQSDRYLICTDDIVRVMSPQNILDSLKGPGRDLGHAADDLVGRVSSETGRPCTAIVADVVRDSGAPGEPVVKPAGEGMR